MDNFDPKNIKVELIRHVAKQKTDLGIVDVYFDQCFVQCNNRRVGIYCGLQDQPGKHLGFTTMPPLPLVVQEAIAAQVAKLTGGVSHFTSPPPDEHEDVTDDSE